MRYLQNTKLMIPRGSLIMLHSASLLTRHLQLLVLTRYQQAVCQPLLKMTHCLHAASTFRVVTPMRTSSALYWTNTEELFKLDAFTWSHCSRISIAQRTAMSLKSSSLECWTCWRSQPPRTSCSRCLEGIWTKETWTRLTTLISARRWTAQPVYSVLARSTTTVSTISLRPVHESVKPRSWGTPHSTLRMCVPALGSYASRSASASPSSSEISTN